MREPDSAAMSEMLDAGISVAPCERTTLEANGKLMFTTNGSDENSTDCEGSFEKLEETTSDWLREGNGGEITSPGRDQYATWPLELEEKSSLLNKEPSVTRGAESKANAPPK